MYNCKYTIPISLIKIIKSKKNADNVIMKNKELKSIVIVKILKIKVNEASLILISTPGIILIIFIIKIIT